MVKKKVTIPKLIFDEEGHAKITTHNDNVYTVRKLSDGEYLGVTSAGNEVDAINTLIAISLVEPAMTKQQVKTELYDGDLIFLSRTLSNYYTESVSFLESMDDEQI